MTSTRKHNSLTTHLTRTSMLTGRTSTRLLPIDPISLLAWLSDPYPPFIQDAFPDLSADDREFILHGITPEEWPVDQGV